MGKRRVRPVVVRLTIDTTLRHKPEVSRIADALGLSRWDTLGRLLTFWMNAQQVCSPDGFVVGLSKAWVDDVTEKPGFADALAAVGWLAVREDPAGLLLPSFERYLLSKPGSKKKPAKDLSPFEAFWFAYPVVRRKGRPAAARSWRTIDPSTALVSIMMAALERHKKTEQWRKDNGKFIPLITTWLNQRRWEDADAEPGGSPARIRAGGDPGPAGGRVIRLGAGAAAVPVQPPQGQELGRPPVRGGLESPGPADPF